MAYRIPNKTVEDQSARTAVGISIPFSTLFTQTYTTREATRTNLLNYLLTNKKERVFNPTYGAGLSNYLFEPLTEETIDAIKELITEGISQNFEKIQILELKVGANDANQTLKIYLNYTITNTNIQDELLISYGTVESVGENNVMNVIQGTGDTFNTNRLL